MRNILATADAPCVQSAATATASASTELCDGQATAQCKSNVYISERQQLENSFARTTSKETTDSRVATCCLATTTAEHTESTPASHESLQRRGHWPQRSSDGADGAEYPSEVSAPMAGAAIGTIVPATVTPKTKIDKLDLTFDNNGICCRDCRSARCAIDGDAMIGSGGKPSVRKLIRKSRSRKQKTQETCHARIRSLSVGNEASFRNSSRRNGRTVDIIGGDGSSGASGKERNVECLNNLRRNDLIDIIRESMEKNRLCFQTNR